METAEPTLGQMKAVIWFDDIQDGAHWSGHAENAPMLPLCRLLVVAGVADGRKREHYARDVREIWQRASFSLRHVITQLAPPGEDVWLYGSYPPQEIAACPPQQEKGQIWIRSFRAYNHELVHVVKRLTLDNLQNQCWWPSAEVAGGSVVVFRGCELGSYLSRIEESLSMGDFLAIRELMVSPHLNASKLPDIMESATLYAYSGGITETMLMMYLYLHDHCLVLDALRTIVLALQSLGFEVFRGQGLATITYIGRHRRLPHNLVNLASLAGS